MVTCGGKILGVIVTSKRLACERLLPDRATSVSGSVTRAYRLKFTIALSKHREKLLVASIVARTEQHALDLPLLNTLAVISTLGRREFDRVPTPTVDNNTCCTEAHRWLDRENV